MVPRQSPITTPWAHRDREATRWANYGLAFCLGIISTSAYDKVPDLWNQGHKLEHVEKVEVPQLKHKLTAEHFKTEAAKQAKDEACQAVVDTGDIGTILHAKKCLTP